MSTQRAIVIHAGARDSYQVSQALLDAGLLEGLVTNVYAEKWAAEKYGTRIPRQSVAVSAMGLAHYALKALWNNWKVERASDRALGRLGRKLAHQRRAALLAYSYYACSAFDGEATSGIPRILFQLHPHPLSVRRLLEEEMELVPLARHSLLHEAELSLSSSAMAELSEEPRRADAILVASSYTKNTLVDNGCGNKPIHVVPYGVDLRRYPLRSQPPRKTGPLRVIWLGQVCQRKGLSYLLDAVRRLSGRNVEILLRGHGRVDLPLLRQYPELHIDLQAGLPRDQVVRDLHSSDIFVLPSLVEGFGHSILEAMSCGLPVITTHHTCGADLITSGRDGFLVPIRSSDAIAERLEWALQNRDALIDMGRRASAVASAQTWARFREAVVAAYLSTVSR